jgi:hypothetical protein
VDIPQVKTTTYGKKKLKLLRMKVWKIVSLLSLSR